MVLFLLLQLLLLFIFHVQLLAVAEQRQFLVCRKRARSAASELFLWCRPHLSSSVSAERQAGFGEVQAEQRLCWGELPALPVGGRALPPRVSHQKHRIAPQQSSREQGHHFHIDFPTCTQSSCTDRLSARLQVTTETAFPAITIPTGRMVALVLTPVKRGKALCAFVIFHSILGASTAKRVTSLLVIKQMDLELAANTD